MVAKKERMKNIKEKGVDKIQEACLEIHKIRKRGHKYKLTAVCKQFGVHKSSVMSRISNSSAKQNFQPKEVPQTVIPQIIKKRIAIYVIQLWQRLTPPTEKEIQKVMMDIAGILGKSFGDKASKGAINYFCRQYELSFRTPRKVKTTRYKEQTSLDHIKSFFYELQYAYQTRPCNFDSEGNVVAYYSQRPDKILNGDETGFQQLFKDLRLKVPPGSSNATEVIEKNKKAITQFLVGNAEGQIFPPIYILSRNTLNKAQQEALDRTRLKYFNAVDSQILSFNIFKQVLKHLAEQIGCNMFNRYMLILDGDTASCNIDVVNVASQYGIDIVLLPANCTSLLQPMEQVFGNVKDNLKDQFFDKYVDFSNTQGSRSISDIVKYMKLVDETTIETLDNRNLLFQAFKKTGIWTDTHCDITVVEEALREHYKASENDVKIFHERLINSLEETQQQIRQQYGEQKAGQIEEVLYVLSSRAIRDKVNQFARKQTNKSVKLGSEFQKEINVIFLTNNQHAQRLISAFNQMRFPTNVKAAGYMDESSDPSNVTVPFSEIDVILLGSNRCAETLGAIWLGLTRLRWIHSMAAGVNRVLTQVPQIVESDIILTNCKGVFDVSLAEYTLAACNWFAKRLDTLREIQKARQWGSIIIEELRGKTFGVIGYGDTGRQCAVLAKAYQMKVIGLKRKPQEAQKDVDSGLLSRVFGSDEILEFIQQCDYSVNVLPQTQAMIKYISRDVIRHMKPNHVFVNIGRGATVDEEALIVALAGGKIKGAALDVTEVEPLPPDSPLYKLDNVLLSYHTAYNTGDLFVKNGMDLFGDLMKSFAQGKELRNIVDKKQGY